MKKKMLVPIMALAIAVTAGVNYKVLSGATTDFDVSLSNLIKNAFADPTEEIVIEFDGNWVYRGEYQDCESPGSTCEVE